MAVWNASNKNIEYSRIYLAVHTADGPGITLTNGLVGHTGARGCRLFCNFSGRRKKGAPTYYCALLRPLGYAVRGCDHADQLPWDIRLQTLDEYNTLLARVEGSWNVNAYTENRRETGITRAIIFSGLPCSLTFGPPRMFPLDVMHLMLNLPSLLLDLWRSTIHCDPTDNRANWVQAQLQGDHFKRHGEDLWELCIHLPGGDYSRPPRDLAYITSSYKAVEWQTYMFVLPHSREMSPLRMHALPAVGSGQGGCTQARSLAHPSLLVGLWEERVGGVMAQIWMGQHDPLEKQSAWTRLALQIGPS
jgi:hypothetical protein